MNIHPLQECSAEFLEKLYKDERLAPTSAMRTILKGYYPSLKSILSTLDYYANEELVQKFVEERAAEVSDARSEVVRSDKEQQEWDEEGRKAEADIRNQNERLTGDFLDRPNPFDYLKSVPVKDIEDALSEALSVVCKGYLVTKVAHIASEHYSSRGSTEVVLHVSNDWSIADDSDKQK